MFQIFEMKTKIIMNEDSKIFVRINIDMKINYMY